MCGPVARKRREQGGHAPTPVERREMVVSGTGVKEVHAAPRRRPGPRMHGGVRAADRALDILSFLASADRVEWYLDEIATGTGLSKSTAHRLLESLNRRGFAEPGSRHGSYRLGLRAAVVGSMALRTRRPSDDVHRMLCASAAEIGDGVGLSVLDGTDAVVVDRAASPHPLQWNLGVGASLPAHVSAAGKVLLAGLSDDAVRRLYSGEACLVRMTSRTVRTVEHLLEQVRKTRRQGYALDDRELDDGLRCVAVPVRDNATRVSHALGVSAPASRTSVKDLLGVVGALERTAAAMSPHITLIARSRWDERAS